MSYLLEEKDLKILPTEIVNEIYSYLPVRPNRYDNCINQINYISGHFHNTCISKIHYFYKYILYKNRSKKRCSW